MLGWPAQSASADFEWLLAVSVPSYWTPGQLEYDVADTPDHRRQLERLAKEPLLYMFGPAAETVDVRPVDVCQVPRMSRPRDLGERVDAQPGFEDLGALRHTFTARHGLYAPVGSRSRLAGSFFAPTAGSVQQVDVLLPDEVGSRLACMFVHAVDGDLALVRMAAHVYAAAKPRGQRATLTVPDSPDGRRLLAALREVGLDHDSLDPRGSYPVLKDGRGKAPASWEFRVLRASCVAHAAMLAAAAARGAARSGTRTLPTPLPIVTPNHPPVAPPDIPAVPSPSPNTAPQLTLF